MRSPLFAFGVLALLAPAAASGQPPRDARSEMDGFAAGLDAVVRRVSRPGPGMPAGRESTRGYRVAGFGAVFVVAPRAWPTPSSRAASERQAARALDEAIRQLEQGLRTAFSPEVRMHMERSLAVLRQARSEMRRMPPGRSTPLIVPAPEEAEAPAGPPAPPRQLRLEQLQREMEKQMAEQMRAVQEAERTDGAGERELARTMEKQAQEMQEQMEAMRREVERERAQAEHQLEMFLAAPPSAPGPPAAAAAASAPEAPPAPEAPMGPAPWQYWFSIDEPGDGRTGEAVVRDVKAAVTALLEKQGGQLRDLRPEEYVAVAVDFVARPLVVGSSRAQKTLVVKVRKRDLDERRAGRLGAEALRQRIEYAEY
jgi:hypothetical protein